VLRSTKRHTAFNSGVYRDGMATIRRFAAVTYSVIDLLTALTIDRVQKRAR
jgi:hypothetical protein